MQPTLLELRVERMSYPGGEAILQEFALDISSGEIASIVGASGAGKTTLLRIIAGLETRFSGKVLFDGKERKAPGPDVQIVFQEHRLLPWLRVVDNVAFALNGGLGDEAHDQVRNALVDVGLGDKLQRWPWQLSGGEEQRVALARTLVRPPRLLLLDEPLRNLDMLSASALLRVIERIVRERTISVILVSHNIEDAVALSDSVHVVAAHPMRIKRTIPISLVRPRARTSMDFSESCAEVVKALERVQSEQPMPTIPSEHSKSNP